MLSCCGGLPFRQLPAEAQLGSHGLASDVGVQEDLVSFWSCIQVGDWLGSHEELAVATMHAYIDQERFGGMAIDAALRQLLAGFRLPGNPPGLPWPFVHCNGENWCSSGMAIDVALWRLLAGFQVPGNALSREGRVMPRSYLVCQLTRLIGNAVHGPKLEQRQAGSWLSDDDGSRTQPYTLRRKVSNCCNVC